MGARDLIKKAWDNAQNSNADIYAEVYDGNYSDIIDYYSQCGNFTYDIISGSLSVGFYYKCNPLLANMRYYLITILMQICCFTCAQVKISSEELIGTKWSLPSVRNEQEEIQFHSGYFMHNWTTEYKVRKGYQTYFHSGDHEYVKRHGENKYDYYLDDKEPEESCFEQYKVGKPSEGVFLICFNNKTKKTHYYKIISYNENEIVLFKEAPELKEGQIAMGGPPHDITLILERIEK